MRISGSSFDKKFALVFILSVVLVISAIPTVAMATDWPQFQKDKIHTGWTTDNAPVYDPELAWWKHTSGTGMGGIDVTPIVGDGATYVLDYQGVLWSFDATTGEENWHTDLTEGSGTFEVSVPAYNEGIVYAAVSSGSEGQGAGRVCAVYANNGTIRECEYYGLQYFQLNTPITYADDKIYISNWRGGASHTEDNGTYYCIDADNVTNEIWNRTAPYVTGYYWAGAAIVGDYMIYGDDRANVTCLYKDNGTFVDYVNVSEAPFNIDDPVEEIRSSIVWNEDTGRIYFTGKKSSPRSGHAYAVGFNSTTGHFDTSDYWVTGIDYSTSTPVVYNSKVYVCMGGMYGGDGKVLKCLNEANGNILYTYDITCPPTGACGSQASLAVSVACGRVHIYFTTNMDNGSAYCVEDTGTEFDEKWVWNPPYPDDQYILQGMAISDGLVYFGTDYGRVYALQEAAPSNLDINTSVALNGDVNISWDGTASSYDIYITDTYPNFGKTPAVTVTDKYWVDTDASEHPKERYYKVAYNVSGVGQRPSDETAGYYNTTAKFGPEPYYTLLSVPHVIETTDINEVLKYNHAPGQRLEGGVNQLMADKVYIQKDDGIWAYVWLRSVDGLWYEGMTVSTREKPSDIGFRVGIKSGHTVPTNVVYRMLMQDTLGDLME